MHEDTPLTFLSNMLLTHWSQLTTQCMNLSVLMIEVFLQCARERFFSINKTTVFFPQHNQGSPQELSKSSLTAQFNDSPLTNSIPMKHRHSPGNRVLLWVKLESRLKEEKKTQVFYQRRSSSCLGDALLHPCLIYLFLKWHFTPNS